MTRTIVLTNHKSMMRKSTSATNIAFGPVNMLHTMSAANSHVLPVDTNSRRHAILVTIDSKD